MDQRTAAAEGAAAEARRIVEEEIEDRAEFEAAIEARPPSCRHRLHCPKAFLPLVETPDKARAGRSR